jgi:hypothetical protein
MRPVAAPLPLVFGASILAVVSACGTDPYEPGTQLGTFQVSGTVTANTCGAGSAPSPWQFSVKLGVDPGTLYWEQGSLPVSGTLSATNVASLQSSSTEAAAGAADAGVTCILERDDSLAATLTPDPKVPGNYSAFTGTMTYSFAEGSGSTDCSMALASNGGGFAALPCTVAYDLTATRAALPNQYGK